MHEEWQATSCVFRDPGFHLPEGARNDIALERRRGCFEELSLWVIVDSRASESWCRSPSSTTFPQPRPRGVPKASYLWEPAGPLCRAVPKTSVRILTEEGHRCLLIMHLTVVQKPLVNVYRIFDAGHRVILRRDGGSIMHLTKVQESGRLQAEGRGPRGWLVVQQAGSLELRYQALVCVTPCGVGCQVGY